MKRLRYLLPFVVASLLLALAARPCGPDFPGAVFVLQTGPGGSYARYAAGDLGVPQRSYRTRHMVIAYDYLTGHSLSPVVQKEALALNSALLGSSEPDKDTGRLPGYDAWLRVRSGFGPVNGFVPDGSLATSRSVPGENYSSFDNCLDDAFATAAKTLGLRSASYGARDPAVMDWVRGQDAVFTNCGDGKAPPYYGPAEKAPVAPPAPRTPAPLPLGAPRWLQQDRAYQLAAASFYHLQFDDALARFQAIAADAESPWAPTSRYLMARTYLRSATLLAQPEGVPVDRAAARQRTLEALQGARHELTTMRSESRMSAMRGAIDHLLDYVNIRLDPAMQAEMLAQRLQSPTAATFRQAAVDLAWLHSSHDYDEHPVPVLYSASHPNDMLAWIDALYGGDEASALQHWRATRSTAWLLVAISFAKPGDPGVPDLLRAAQSISKGDPGWFATAYHRLRLSPLSALNRADILALLQQAELSGDASRINLLLTLSAATSPTFTDWLASATRIPAGETSWSDGEITLPPKMSASTENSVSTTGSVAEDACGRRLSAGTVLPLFDTDAAVMLNREIPLRLLAEAAAGSQLPANPRLQVAQAAWTRAVLLNKPAIARQMTPILAGCRPAWKPVLAAYDTASTDNARHAAGLLALMRFASTVPGVWEGEERRQGFATYDEFRENWWCSTVPKPGETFDSQPDQEPRANSNPLMPAWKVNVPSPPPFLTPSDLAEARSEVAALERIPRASTYFAQEALLWQKLHPADADTPEILGEADRVLRNSCRKDSPLDAQGRAMADNPADMTLTSNLAKAIFQALHGKYPNSTWAKRYRSWQ